MKHVVAFTAHHRVDYLKQVLESWSRVRGIEDAHLLFRCEPGHPEIVDICQSVDFAGRVTVIVNEDNQGPLTNPWLALEDSWYWADQYGLDFVILAEDDTTVSNDVLEYYTWAADKYRYDEKVLIAGAFCYESLGDIADVIRSQKFYCWVWGTWRDRWYQKLRNDWDHDYRYRGWDHRITDYWLGERGYQYVGPAQSRSQDIGIFGGVHSSPALFAGGVSRCFNPDVPAQDYRDIGEVDECPSHGR